MSSDTGAVTLDRANREYAARGATATHPTASDPTAPAPDPSASEESTASNPIGAPNRSRNTARLSPTFISALVCMNQVQKHHSTVLLELNNPSANAQVSAVSSTTFTRRPSLDNL